MFAGADADNLLDRLDPNLAVSNGTASWKRRGNGRETNGNYASKEAASAPVPASAGTARGLGRGGR